MHKNHINKYSFTILLVVITYIFLLFYFRTSEYDVQVEAIRAGLHQQKITVSNQYSSRQQIIWVK